MPSVAAAAMPSSMRTVPSTIENSLCRRRWTKVGADMDAIGRDARILLRSPCAVPLLDPSRCASSALASPLRVVAAVHAHGDRRLCADGDGSATGPPPRDRRRRRSRRTRSRRRPRQPVRLPAALPAGLRRRLRAARPVPSARTRRASPPTATTAPAGRTASRCAERSDSRRGAAHDRQSAARSPEPAMKPCRSHRVDCAVSTRTC